jgi:hypothetical protein
MVVEVAHCPASGVKVKSPPLALLLVKLHEPVIPLFDVLEIVTDCKLHTGSICVKLGVTVEIIETVIEAVVAHSPASGVNV